jgi:hypothetical protein
MASKAERKRGRWRWIIALIVLAVLEFLVLFPRLGSLDGVLDRPARWIIADSLS